MGEWEGALSRFPPLSCRPGCQGCGRQSLQGVGELHSECREGAALRGPQKTDLTVPGAERQCPRAATTCPGQPLPTPQAHVPEPGPPRQAVNGRGGGCDLKRLLVCMRHTQFV